MLLPSWLADLLTLDVLLQYGAFALTFVLGLPTSALVARLLMLAEARAAAWPPLKRVPWLAASFMSLRKLAYPLAVLLLCNVAVGALENAGRPTLILSWLSFFVALWVVYRLLATLIDLHMRPEHAHTWKYQILRPLIWLTALLHGLGLLDNVLEFGLQPSADVLITLRSVLLGGIIIYGFMFLSRNARSFLRESFLPRTGMDTALTQVLSTLASYTILVAGILVGLGTIGINLTTLTVIAGGVSVGLGFGLQSLFNNFVSGFILLSERSLVPGDVVRIEDRVGVVEDITLRTTQIRTDDNIEYIVPNGHFLDSIVTNYTRDTRKIQIHIAVAATYETSPQLVIAALRDAGEHPATIPDQPCDVLVTEFGESMIHYRLLVWIDEPLAQDRVTSDLRLRIWDIFQQRGIAMTPPDPVLRLEPPSLILTQRER